MSECKQNQHKRTFSFRFALFYQNRTMYMKFLMTTMLALIFGFTLAQEVQLEGYVYESDNRGYLNQVVVKIKNSSSETYLDDVYSDKDGHFEVAVPKGNYELTFIKDLFHEKTMKLSDASLNQDGKYFFKVKLQRKPGYLFDLTMAEEKIDSLDTETRAITHAWVEVYNNTTQTEEFNQREFPYHNFQFTLTKGNHYTFMIRKAGYFTKRIEAFVNVEGCILCIDGISKLTPGVTDNLTEGHEMGTLLANLEMKKAEVGTTIKIDNLYYDLDKYKVTENMTEILSDVRQLLNDNPGLSIQMGSHTDAQGKDEYNQKLSQKRADHVVKWLLENSDIPSFRISAYGYGENVLTNKCSNGVTCSDEEHAANRRTEIKVTGITKEEELSKLSLAEIKNEAKLELLLDELENQEQVQIKPGDELPEDLKRQIEKDKKKEKKKDN